MYIIHIYEYIYYILYIDTELETDRVFRHKINKNAWVNYV